ncbi:hypothetical protein FI667_g12199, partial [Globisporangium splendens]
MPPSPQVDTMLLQVALPASSQLKLVLTTHHLAKVQPIPDSSGILSPSQRPRSFSLHVLVGDGAYLPPPPLPIAFCCFWTPVCTPDDTRHYSLLWQPARTGVQQTQQQAALVSMVPTSSPPATLSPSLQAATHTSLPPLASAEFVCRNVRPALDSVVCIVSDFLDYGRPEYWKIPQACEKNDLRLLQRLTTRESPSIDRHCKAYLARLDLAHAVKHDSMEMIRWLHAYCSMTHAHDAMLEAMYWSTRLGNVATQNQDSHVLQWLMARHPASLLSAISSAARHGHFAIVKWLHENRQCEVSGDVLGQAAGNGHLETANRINRAAEGGHLDVIQWLHASNLSTCSTDAMDFATENGRLAVVQWHHENRSEGCLSSAAIGGLSQVAQEGSAAPFAAHARRRHGVYFYKNRENAPSNKVLRLLAEAEQSAKKDDREGALKHCLHAYSITKATNSQDRHSFELAFAIAAQFETLGKVNQATVYYQEALGNIPYVRDAATRDLNRVVTLDRIAQCYQDKGEQVTAEKYYKQAVSVYDASRATEPPPDAQFPVDREIPAVLFNYGQQLMHLKRWDEAAYYLRRALALARGESASVSEENVAKIESMLQNISSGTEDAGNEGGF